MTIETNGPSSVGISNEDGFRELGIRLEDIGFCARGAILEDRIKDLESAGLELGIAPCPVFVPIGDVPYLGTVHLLNVEHNSRTFHFAAGGMRGRLTVQSKEEWFLKIHGGGPHPLSENRLAELEVKARRIKEYFFGKDARVELGNCSVALYGRNSEDPATRRDTFEDFLDFRVTRGECIGTSRRTPGSDEELISCLFGSASAGRQVRLAVWGGGYPSPTNREVFAWLEENADYLEHDGIVCIELIFHSPFIRPITSGIRATSNDLNLPRLLRDLVRMTVGDEALPNPFYRAVDWGSRGLPVSLRPNSAAWERVRRAFIDAVGVSGQSPGTGANP